MYEYIERRAANDAVMDAIWHGKRSMHDVASAINSVPNADVAPVRHGRWINSGTGWNWCYECSICGWRDGYPFEDRHNYCPNCGAKMEGELNE